MPTTPLNQEELAARWTQAQRRVEAFIVSLVVDFHQASDILQNVAMVVVRKREEYDPQRPFLPWVLQIAQLEVLKHRRTHARDRHVFSEELIEQLAAASGELSGDLIERRQALSQCIQRVTGRGRQALVLRYVEGLKASEVAQRLGLAAGATRMLLLRVREALRTCIEHHLAQSEGES
jgi:RNA polymerase sigma-70 factor (ECF subfamily)